MNQRSVHQDSHAETLQKRKSKWDVLEEFDLDKHYSAELFEWLISSILRDKGIDVSNLLRTEWLQNQGVIDANDAFLLFPAY